MGVASVSFQIELASHPNEVINRIKNCGMKAGLAYDYATSIENLYLLSDRLDYCLFMASGPDDMGEKFQPPILYKIRAARAALPERVSIWADGGINEGNVLDVIKSGVDTVIMGRAVFGADNPEKAMDSLYKKIGESLA